MDKDLLQIGNEFKIYSPETAIFIPTDINSFLTSITNNKKGYTFSKEKQRWIVQVKKFKGKNTHIGIYDSEEEARINYIENKNIEIEKVIKLMKDLNIYSNDIISLINKMEE